jgi:hypothetical protein
MADKKHQISVNLSDKSLDRVCSKLDMNRALVLRTIFGDSVEARQLIFDMLNKVDAH